MDDLDRVLSRLAAATRRHADDSVDVDAALESTLARSAETSDVAELADRRSPRAWYAAGAASLVGLLLVGVWALTGETSGDRLVPVSPVEPAVTEPAESAPIPTAPDTSPATDPVTTAPGVPASPAPSVAPTTTEATDPQPDAGPCRTDGSIEQAAADFYEAMLIARTLDDLDPVKGCLDTVPAVFDGTAPNCWAECDAATRVFLPDTFSVYEQFSPTGDTQWGSSASVSYTTANGDYLDVTEWWSITQTPDGFTVEDFAIEEQSFLTRDESAATITTYFDHIENGDWQAAAAMLNDGAQNNDERPDLRQLEPATFTLPDIARALQDWCQLGCDTRPPTPVELSFDGRYGIERNGQSVRAAWYEGTYSISGLPIRTPDSLAANFDAGAILTDDNVTNDEYRTMFAFVRKCAAEAGAPSTIAMADFDALDQRFDYSIPGDSGDIFETCYQAHGAAIDIAFQVDPSRTAQRETNYSRIADCLDAAGIDYRALAQQHSDSQPADFPTIAIDELSIDEILQYAMINGATNTTIASCTNLGAQLAMAG